MTRTHSSTAHRSVNSKAFDDLRLSMRHDSVAGRLHSSASGATALRMRNNTESSSSIQSALASLLGLSLLGLVQSIHIGANDSTRDPVSQCRCADQSHKPRSRQPPCMIACISRFRARIAHQHGLAPYRRDRQIFKYCAVGRIAHFLTEIAQSLQVSLQRP